MNFLLRRKDGTFVVDQNSIGNYISHKGTERNEEGDLKKKNFPLFYQNLHKAVFLY